jgi:sigma-E factor negative regulatory protein RseA
MMKSEISALMDGELDDKAAAALLAQIKQEDELLASWNTFHAISDALHETYLHTPKFPEKFRQRLEKEPTIIAPQPRLINSKPVTYALSAAASVAAVGFVLWAAYLGNSIEPTQVAKQEAVVGVSSGPSPQVVNDYLLAHHEFSPSTVMQGVAPYVRSVSVEGADFAR